MKIVGIKIISTAAAVILMIGAPVLGEEMLSLYGLKGYAYTNSPLVADGFHLQTGAMYSLFHERNLERRDGYVWVMPASATYGDGKLWEIALASHYEYWKNTDFDVDEKGFGDLVVSGKIAILKPDKKPPVNLSLMPYLLIPTGDRDKSIGDLFRYSPGADDDFSYGLNLLLGKSWRRFCFSANLGVNYLDTSEETLKDVTWFIGAALEYQISESLSSYTEFFNNENKLDVDCFDPCYDTNTNDDIREIGAGVVWVKNNWGTKFHMGYGLTETSPDFRALALINWTFP